MKGTLLYTAMHMLLKEKREMRKIFQAKEKFRIIQNSWFLSEDCVGWVPLVSCRTDGSHLSIEYGRISPVGRNDKKNSRKDKKIVERTTVVCPSNQKTQ